MKLRAPAVCLSVFALAWSLPALAQSNLTVAADAPSEEDDTPPLAGEIVVIAERIKGQLDVPQKPIEVLDERDIASYGANSISDLLAALSPQTGSGRGRGGGGMPIMLINGQRISSFREMRDMPPEAIRRMEILPEEVALRFGYPANARVVNLILKDNFAQRRVDVEYGMPDRGGSATSELQASLFSVANGGRVNLTGTHERTAELTEAERGLIQLPGSAPAGSTDSDLALARTLIADRTASTINATWAKGLGKNGLNGSLTLNGTMSLVTTNQMSGLTIFGDPLRRSNQTASYQAGAGYNRPLGAWQLSATVDAGRTDSDTRIDRRPAAGSSPQTGIGADRAWTTSDTVSSLVTLIGRPAHLPGGDITMTVKGGYAYTGITSEDTRSAVGRTALSRNDLSAGVNIGIPITSRREGFLEAVGNLSLNLSAGINDLSDFGSLKDWSAGLNWGVTEKLNLQASYLVNEKAPSLAELGNPQIVSFNVPVFDFTRGETALVTVTGGGNPGLLKETDRDLKFGFNWQTPLKNTMLLGEFFRNRSTNVTESFPVLTPAIEAAFPGRVTRDASGRLIAIDRRPVTFFAENASRLRWGLNVNGPIGKAPEGGGAAGMPGGGRGPGGGGGRMGGGRMGGGGGPPMMGPMGGGNGQGRWNLALFHTVQFQNTVTVAPGGPVLDLLDGAALTGGGVARHSLEADAGFFYRGFGTRVNATYTAPTRIDGTGLPGSSDLRFGSVTKVNLRMFANLDQMKGLVKGAPWLKGVRVSLVANNLLDSRQRVTDGTGSVPISYQPDLIDPTGRFIGIDISKRF